MLCIGQYASLSSGGSGARTCFHCSREDTLVPSNAVIRLGTSVGTGSAHAAKETTASMNIVFIVFLPPHTIANDGISPPCTPRTNRRFHKRARREDHQSGT